MATYAKIYKSIGAINQYDLISNVNIPLTGVTASTLIDNETMTDGMYVVLGSQTITSEFGVYTVSTAGANYTLNLFISLNATATVATPMQFSIAQGGQYADTLWKFSLTNVIPYIDLILSPVKNPIAGNILKLSAEGGLVDSGKTFGNDGTNNTVPTSAETQSYVTAALLNTPTLPAVNFATTANITTFSGLGAIDGYTPTAGQTLLVKNQTNNDNSVWLVAVAAWTRAYFNTTTGAWTPITTQTTYAQLNINGPK